MSHDVLCMFVWKLPEDSGTVSNSLLWQWLVALCITVGYALLTLLIVMVSCNDDVEQATCTLYSSMLCVCMRPKNYPFLLCCAVHCWSSYVAEND